MPTQFHQFPYNDDNYGVLVHDTATGQTACVDAGDGAAVQAALAQTGWTLTQLWITHHHWDHTDDLAAVKSATGCHVIGPGYDGSAKLAIDQHVRDGDSFTLGNTKVTCIHTPGHTLDMINYHLAEDAVVFTGDTLFAMGCGRVFEGTFDQMYQSMERLLALPDDTVVYGGHEYTQANAAFALSVDPTNADLQTRAKAVCAARAKGEPTMPTTMAKERATNPFLRYGDAQLRAHLGMADATDAAVFAELRGRKDRF
ncbi:MAG: hydroxyacylglutathione hydrolase [Pseudomonadota bacterium]